MSKRDVVVTGLGVVSPVGNNVPEMWASLMAGRSGIGRVSHFDPTDFPCQVAGEVKGFDPASTGLDAKDLKKCDRFILLGLAAAREALLQAGLADKAALSEEFRERVAVVVGTGIGGLPAIEEAAATLREKGPKRISPFFIPAMLPNLLAGQLSIQYGFMGANVCPVSACATSAHAIGWGKRLIEWGEADVVIVGGAESTVCPTSMAGFSAMRAMSTGFNETPEKASRPFDAARDGFVMGEGAAVMVLEAADVAARRGARALARLRGFAQTADASHVTLADGRGSLRAMRLALAEAGLQPSDVGYVNAHATSTPAGDAPEAAAIAEVFGDRIAVSSTKSMTGHLLGAAGALEAVISVMALREQVLPPTLNADNVDVALDVVPHTARRVSGVTAALSNSFGFGGTNASLIFSL